MVIWRRIYGREPFMGYSFRLAARYILYIPTVFTSHIQHLLLLGSNPAFTVFFSNIDTQPYLLLEMSYSKYTDILI